MAKRMAKNRPSKSVLEKNKLLRQQQVTKFFYTSLLMLSLVLIFGSLSYLSYQALDKPLDKVQLSAPFERVSTLEVEKVLAKYKGNKFLSVNLSALQKDLEQVAWVDVAEVSRSFPASLRITLTEHIAAARWGESGLLNTRGELILKQARYLPPELPRLDGPDGSEWKVAQQYLELRTTVLNFGLNIDALILDARGAWSFTLSNGMRVQIGREATDQRFYRFSKRVLPLLDNLEQIASVVDMRYSNGFAVKWQEIKQIENQQSSFVNTQSVLGEKYYA